MLLYFIFSLVFASTFFFSLGIITTADVMDLKPHLAPHLPGVRAKRKFFLFYLLDLFTPLNRRLLLARVGNRIKDRLTTANSSLSVGRYLALKQVCALLAFLLMIFIVKARVNPGLLTLVTVFGFLLPDLWINYRIRKRRVVIVRQLPSVIDLLSLTVGAGLDLMSAISLVVKKSKPNPLTEELFNIIQETRMGKTRREALRTMAKRLNVPEVSSLVRTLVQAERMGTGIDEALRIHSEEATRSRFERGERLALQAPLKLLVPLIFCILPVVFIIVAGPIILQFMQMGNIFK